jgi:hypothetical protein
MTDHPRPVPDWFHFVFGLKPQTEPFHLIFYLCLKSCLDVNRPRRIIFHYHHPPYGEWWDRIKPHLELRRIELEPLITDSTRYDDHNEGRVIRLLDLTYAHQADFLRLKILLEEGGVYADIDSLFVRPYPPSWYESDFLIGEEAPVPDEHGRLRPSLCNALMFSRPASRFARRWLALSYEEFDGSWSRHSGSAAAKVREQMPDEVRVVAPEHCYRFMWTRRGLTELFLETNNDLEAVYSIHLWAHLWWDADRVDFIPLHAGSFTPTYIRSVDTTYNLLARRYLPEDI